MYKKSVKLNSIRDCFQTSQTYFINHINDNFFILTLLLISQLIAAAVYWTMFDCMMVKGREVPSFKMFGFLGKIGIGGTYVIGSIVINN